jgi:UDP:flavonoid glycosyltransferase YjiC (YdhE family)
MIPVAQVLKRRGCEVIFAADAPLLEMAGRELPGIMLVEIPGLRIRYSRHLPQYISIFLQLPHIIASAFSDHRTLRRLVRELNPSLIISDNRFGFYHREVFSVYVTHQLRIPFPTLLRFMELPAAWLHRLIINRFDLCLVPDYPGETNLTGRLSHGMKLPRNVVYKGPLSRFDVPDIVPLSPFPGSHDTIIAWLSGHDPVSGSTAGAGNNPDRPPDISIFRDQPYACLILSGPEPQRSMLLEKVAESFDTLPLVVLSATPLKGRIHPDGEIRLIISPDKTGMRDVITGASLVIARAGYTSVMELASLGKGAVLIPTPGQTEQEYLGKHLNGRFGFITMHQDRTHGLADLVPEK